jgi:hypothetical protein
LTAIVLYLLGIMLFHLICLPVPVAMLFLAVAAKLGSAVSPRLQSGGQIVYRFVWIGMTYPLLFAIGDAARRGHLGRAPGSCAARWCHIPLEAGLSSGTDTRSHALISLPD